MKVLFGRLDRDLTTGLYLDFKLEVESAESGRKIEILDENGIQLYETPDYVSTGDIIYENIPVNRDFFPNYTTTFKIKAVNSSGNTINAGSIKVDTYKVSVEDVEVKHIKNEAGTVDNLKTYVRWKYDNFSVKSMDARILFYPIKDENKDISYDTLPSNYTNSKYLYPTRISKDDSGKETVVPNDIKINARELNMQPVTCADLECTKVFSSISEGSTAIILYRIALIDRDNGLISFYPKKGAFRYRASYVNEEPIIRLEDISVLPDGNAFKLYMNSLLRDSNLDDVRYTITDNHGNTIFQHDYYEYTPRIDKINFQYDNYNFNSLFLKFTAQISDNMNYGYTKVFSYPLFEVTNLRMRRDRLLWDVRNYSNVAIKTTVEILDMYNNVVYTGDTISTRLEKTPITVTDDKIVDLLVNLDEDGFYQYYKFRIRVRCDDENYTGYVEFENGTLVSTQHHNAPVITIYEGKYPSDYITEHLRDKEFFHLERDADNNKRIKLIFDLDNADDSAIGDYCQYTVSDDSGNVIYSSKDTITLPQRIELYQDYDFTRRIYNLITVTCINEYGNSSTKTVEIPSYYIRNARVLPETQKIAFDADNYYEGDITIVAEVHDLYYDEDLYSGQEGMPDPPKDKSNKYDFETELSSAPIIREQSYTLTPTEKTTRHYVRIIPKIYYDRYGLKYQLDALKPRFRVEAVNQFTDDGEQIRFEDKYIEVKGYIEPILNKPPAIMFNYARNEIDEDAGTITSIVSMTMSDGEGDRITYSVSDRYGEISGSSLLDIGEDNVENIIIKKTYNLKTIESSMIQWNFLCTDEEGLAAHRVHKIPLHYISSVIFENGNLSYKAKLYSNKTIKTELEIMDDEGYLYAKGKVTPVSYYDDLKTITESISIKKFRPGNYRYRIKVTSEGENWQLYYPNLNGEIIYISQEMIDADAVTNTNLLTINETNQILLDELEEYRTILGEKIKVGSYTSSDTTILGRLYNTMGALSGDDRTNAIIELLDIFSNHHDSITIDLREYGDHLMSKLIDNDGVEMEVMKGYNNYGMDINNYLYNINGYPLEFIIKEDKHLPYEKYHARGYVNGRKILENRTNAQILNDGMTKFYVGTDDVPNNSCFEAETHKTLLDYVENEIYSYVPNEPYPPTTKYDSPIEDSDIEIYEGETTPYIKRTVTRIAPGNYKVRLEKSTNDVDESYIVFPSYAFTEGKYYTSKISVAVTDIAGNAILEIRNAAFREDRCEYDTTCKKILNLEADWEKYSINRTFETSYTQDSIDEKTVPRLVLYTKLSNAGDVIEFEFKDAQIEERSYDVTKLALKKVDVSFDITSMDDIHELRNGKIIDDIPQYYLDNDFIAYIERDNSKSTKNKNRINLLRAVVRKNSGSSIKVIIHDPVYVGDRVVVVTNTVEERIQINTSYMSGGTSAAASAVKPVYFVPLCFIDNAGNMIDISDDDLQNNLDVYANGLIAIPHKDYIVLPQNVELSLPPVLLFRELIYPNTELEIYFRNRDKSTSTIFVDALSLASSGYYYLDVGADYKYPLVKGMFTVYCNNKKIPTNEVTILNKRYLVFKKNAITTKSNENFYIKVNYPDNPIVNKLLELYKNNAPSNDSLSIDSLLANLDSSTKSKLLNSSNIEVDNDVLEFLIYVYQLENSDKFKFLKEMKDKIDISSDNMYAKNGLDASISNLFEHTDGKDVITEIMEVPKYFNHNIDIFAGSNLLQDGNFEDNIKIANPSRVLRLQHYIDLSNGEIDCSNNIGNDDYDIFINEGVDIDMDYIVGDIELERNKKK